MNKSNIAKFFKNVRVTVSKHSPEILTGIGLAGMVTTTVLAVKATPKALRILEEERENRKADRENGVDEQFAPEKISALDTVKLCWKCYIPAVISGATSAACIIGASSTNAKRNAALATAYKLSEAAFAEYKEKVVETIGEKKEKTVREQIAKEQLEQHPVAKNEVIITGRGTSRFFDSISKRHFKSDIETIRRVQNDLNREMINDLFGYVSLNDLYIALGLEPLSIGDGLGWNLDQMIDLDFDAQIDSDGEPSIVLTYTVAPKYNYDKLP